MSETYGSLKRKLNNLGIHCPFSYITKVAGEDSVIAYFEINIETRDDIWEKFKEYNQERVGKCPSCNAYECNPKILKKDNIYSDRFKVLGDYIEKLEKQIENQDKYIKDLINRK